MVSQSARITAREFQCVRFLQVAAFAICGGDAGGEGFRPLALAREIASRTQRPQEIVIRRTVIKLETVAVKERRELHHLMEVVRAGR